MQRTLRRARGTTSQYSLAKKAGVNRSTINRLEKGLNRPTYDTVLKIAKALGCEPADIKFPAVAA